MHAIKQPSPTACAQPCLRGAPVNVWVACEQKRHGVGHKPCLGANRAQQAQQVVKASGLTRPWQLLLLKAWWHAQGETTSWGTGWWATVPKCEQRV